MAGWIGIITWLVNTPQCAEEYCMSFLASLIPLKEDINAGFTRAKAVVLALVKSMCFEKACMIL